MSEKTEKFIGFLWRLDRKGFAELRRSLSQAPGESIGAIPYVERFTLGETTPWNRQMYYLVAGLFCLVERPLELNQSAPKSLEQNLGESMAQLYLAKEKSGSIEQRFIRLLDADEEQLVDRLRQNVTLLKSNNIAIGWEQLLEDLGYWRAEHRSVQHRWARSFYLKAERENQPEEAAQEPQAVGGNE